MLSLSLSLFYYTGNVARSGQADRFFWTLRDVIVVDHAEKTPVDN
jgi:hypothetical protein